MPVEVWRKKNESKTNNDWNKIGFDKVDGYRTWIWPAAKWKSQNSIIA